MLRFDSSPSARAALIEGWVGKHREEHGSKKLVVTVLFCQCKNAVPCRKAAVPVGAVGRQSYGVASIASMQGWGAGLTWTMGTAV